MSRFDEYFEFRLATKDDIDDIMHFIRCYWGKKDHILGVDRAFFEYEFCLDDRVGFFIALDKKTGEIVAGEGIYYYSKEFIQGETDISGGMFLANPECKIPLVGIELMKRKIELLNPRALVGPGVNINTSGQLYVRKLKQDVSRMKHYYILNNSSEYKVAKIIKKYEPRSKDGEQLKLIHCCTASELFDVFRPEVFKDRKPYKDRWYINKRYFEHPIYSYQVFAAEEGIALVMRQIEVNKVSIMRLIDVLGDVGLIAKLWDALRKIISSSGCEYIDFYELGVNESDILKAGFIERVEHDENIIPNYFEPFEQRNVEIYAQRLDRISLCFKGDGDQDRPNHR